MCRNVGIFDDLKHKFGGKQICKQHSDSNTWKALSKISLSRQNQTSQVSENIKIRYYNM